MIKATDNTNGHESYWMTQVNKTLWKVSVPVSAYNITFNRYSEDKTTQWNSWSAGGRDVNNTYYALGSEYGYWGSFEEDNLYFHAGDVIYLDLSEFILWENDNALMYVNFTNASKTQNFENDICILSADKKLYNPKVIEREKEDYIYYYKVTPEDEGRKELRFWRGNSEKLWNCSIVLSHNDYLQGLNCIKVTGWNENFGSLVHRETFENKDNIFDKSWEEMEDSDGDGLPDSYENEIGTNFNNTDTDGDGLTDGFEVLYASTNPLKLSTLENGVSDADLDIDKDGLTMLQEYRQGTDPLDADTDGDGLNDGEELNLYGTDPLNPDTDGDVIKDGDEIFLDLNPLDSDTFGYPDSEYIYNQIINSEHYILEEINKDNNDYQMSIEIKTKGSAFDNLIIRESAYNRILDNESILGTVPEIIYTGEEKAESLKLSFKISSKNIYEDYSSEEFKGIKILCMTKVVIF